MIINIVDEKKKVLRIVDKLEKEARNSVLNEIRTIEMLERNPITEEMQYKWFLKAKNSRADAAKIYQMNNRNDLYEKEIAEQKVAEEYLKFLETQLPKQLSEEEVEKIIVDLKNQGNCNIGIVMKYFNTNYPNQRKDIVSKVFNKLK